MSEVYHTNEWYSRHSLVTHRKAKHYARTGAGTARKRVASCAKGEEGGRGNHSIRTCGLANIFVEGIQDTHAIICLPSLSHSLQQCVYLHISA